MVAADAPPATDKVVWRFVLGGFASLLVSAYHDNIRGPLLPLVAADLKLAFTDLGWFLAVGYAAATAAMPLLMRALNRAPERTVLLVVAAVGLATDAFASAVTGTGTLLVLAAFTGAVVSSVGTMANVLTVEGTPPAKSGATLSAMHAMFGIGSMAATAAVGFGASRGVPWRTFYLVGVPAFAALFVYAATKLKRTDKDGAPTTQSARLSGVQWLVIATFAVYVAGEVTANVWMTSYLVSAHGLTVAEAAPYLTTSFLVMAACRVGCAFVVKPRHEPLALRLAILLPILCFGLAFAGVTPALGLVGLFGPFFPLFLARASRAFPKTWRSMTIWTIFTMNILLVVGHLSLGRLADGLGIATAYALPALLLGVAFVLLNLCLRRLDRPLDHS